MEDWVVFIDSNGKINHCIPSLDGQNGRVGRIYAEYKNRRYSCVFEGLINQDVRYYFVNPLGVREVFDVEVIEASVYEDKEDVYEMYRQKRLIIQDCHSKEWREWLADRARYYNDGFAEAHDRMPWGVERTIEAVITELCTIGTFNWRHVDTSSYNYNGFIVNDVNVGYGKIVKRHNKIWLIGDSYDEGPLDDYAHPISWEFDTLDEAIACVTRHHGTVKMK